MSRRGRPWPALGLAALVGCSRSSAPAAAPSPFAPGARPAALSGDPTASAAAPLASVRRAGFRSPPDTAPAFGPARPLGNAEAPIPAQCYTRTDGTANPCWTCHTTRNGTNFKGDWQLQEVYAFSDVGRRNHWRTLFEDPRPALARIADADVWRYVREDNYTPWQAGRPGGAPGLDLARGFDAEGFARDGSGWRAVKYQPFPGTFWPTNGASDDVYVRLPPAYRQAADGTPSRAVAKLNLALLEAAVAVPDTVADADLRRAVEPVDERLLPAADGRALGADLDGDGRVTASAAWVRGLPATYAGAARPEPVRRWTYPAGTELLHTVRYLDPDAPGWLSARVKEVRYAVKTQQSSPASREAFYREAAEEKRTGRLPWFAAAPGGGYRSPLGWDYRGWIEDARGRLRPQDAEETLACMGCHGGLGITVDASFGLPRKLPGAAGWAPQSLEGQRDRPQAGHLAGEVLTYLQRVGGGDEFRANNEMQRRWFPNGRLDAAAVRAADLDTLLLPSRARALALNKAYWLLVRGQRFKEGRTPLLAPARKVFARVDNGSTALRARQKVYSDGRLWLDEPTPSP